MVSSSNAIIKLKCIEAIIKNQHQFKYPNAYGRGVKWMLRQGRHGPDPNITKC